MEECSLTKFSEYGTALGFFPQVLSETLMRRAKYEEYVKRTQFNTTGFEVRVFDADGNIILSQKQWFRLPPDMFELSYLR